MNRTIYSIPRNRNRFELNFEWLVEVNNGLLTDKDIAETLAITEREVRKIAERYNNFKFIDFDNHCRYSKVDKKYMKIVPNTKLGNDILEIGRYNFIADCKRNWNREKLLGNKQFGSMTIAELINEYKGDELNE